jgi:hypothetical protein
VSALGELDELETSTPRLDRPAPPALDPGSAVARALHDIWIGCRTAEVVIPSMSLSARSERIEAVAAVAAHLGARSDLAVRVAAPWHDDRVDLAWSLARYLPRDTISCPIAQHPRQPPEGVTPNPPNGLVFIGSSMTHSPYRTGPGIVPGSAVTVAFADHEDELVQGQAWSMDARIVSVAPCSIVPRSFPRPELARDEVPFDIVIAGAPTER